MRLHKLSTNYLFLPLLFFFFCCTKTDVVKNEAEIDFAAAAKKPKEVKSCNVFKMTFSTFDEKHVYTFTYNKQGQPVSAISNQRGTYGAYHYYFRYNKKHQLTDVIEAFRIEDGQYLYNTWKRPQYNNKGLIVSDTTFYFGLGGTSPQETFANGFFTNQYTYDGQNRIIKVVQKESNEEGELYETIDTYAYNSKGNLEGFDFDNNVNINRTNEVWMFLNRDYSVNNKVKAQTYNSAGLPVIFSNSYVRPFLPFDNEGSIVFEYDCKGNN